MAPTSPRRPSHPGWQQSQPASQTLSLRALLELPFRMCNPPPAVRKSRSCGVTPVYQIKLEDVLDRKHLPPLGLKDFEEYLLFVEECPEELYFTLWLKEYTKRYAEWMSQRPRRPSIKPSSEAYRVQNNVPIETNPAVALFYAKAQKTFFASGSPYKLDAPADVLAPFVANLTDDGMIAGLGPYGAHPEPNVFTELDLIVRQRLKLSLDRFVQASYHNVGNARAWCGFVGGTTMLLAGTVAPITLNFVRKSARWERLAALPGMWLGLTVIIASLHGVCLMIYLFGDLRQLRRFEMTRPNPEGSNEKRPDSARVPVGAPLTRPPLLQYPTPLSSHNGAQGPFQMPPPAHRPSVVSAGSGDWPGAVEYVLPQVASPPQTKQVRIKSPSPSPSIIVRADSKSSVHFPPRTSIAAGPGQRQRSPASSTYSFDSGVDVLYDEDGNRIEESPVIEISAAMYDEIPDESDLPGAVPRAYSPVQVVVGPEELKMLDRIPMDEQDYLARAHRPSTASSGNGAQPTDRDRWRTASFIPSYVYNPKLDLEAGRAAPPVIPADHDGFEFEGLPPRPPRIVVDTREPPGPAILASPRSPTAPSPKSPTSPGLSHFTPASSHAHLPLPAPAHTKPPVRRSWTALRLVGGLQERCSKLREPKTWEAAESAVSLPPAALPLPPRAPGSRRRRLREMLTVPAFRSPLTRVLSPVVTRAQWEIVVRSGLIAGVVSLAICGSLLAIPVY